jgi:hypothetical protein
LHEALIPDFSSAGDLNPAIAELHPERRQELPAREGDPPGTYDLTLLRSFRSSESREESSPPYLVYIGMILAIAVAVLAYMVWRSSQPQSAHAPSPAQPAIIQPAPVSTSVPQTAATHAAQERNLPQERSRHVAPIATETTAAAKPAKSAVPSAMQSQDLNGAVRDNGSEELAMARHFLGANGESRDSSEAAKWLWKSIAKHNGEATILLADLYLKGDGVSKNCDQARVLLDSAARKGLPGAGDRLRNLQAFNCQ